MTDVSGADTPSKPAGPFSAWEVGLAMRYLRARRKEGGIALIAIISYVAIALAVMALIIVMSIMAGFRAELLDRMLSFNGHMFVQGQVLNDPDRDAALTRIAAVPGVAHVTPMVENQSLVRSMGQQPTGAFVRGIRPQDLDSMTYVYASLSEEARRSFGQGDYGGENIIIGKTLAEFLGVRVGDPVTLYSPSGAGSALGNLGGLEKNYRVAGVFTSGAADFDRAYIFMPMEQAQLFFGKEGVWDLIELKVDHPDRVGELLTPVRQAAGVAMVTDWRDRLAAFWGALKVERVAMSIILGLVVGIAALNIISGIVMLVKNKTRDIAILRTVGASQSSMLRIFFMAGAIIGIAGTLTGLFLGLVFCLNIAAIQHFLEGLLGVQLFNADVYMLDAIPAQVDPADVVWVTVWSVFMSCVASLLPSWRAAKMDPVEALRYE